MARRRGLSGTRQPRGIGQRIFMPGVAALAGIAGCSAGIGCGGGGNGAATDAALLENGARASAGSNAEGRTGRFRGVLTLTRDVAIRGAVSMVNLDLATEQLTYPRQVGGVSGTRRENGELAYAHRCGGGWGLFIADADGTPKETVFECADRGGVSDDFSFIRWSPDGERIALVPSVLLRSPEGTLVVSRTGEDLAFFVGYTGPAWTPDGRLLLRGDGLWMTNRELGDLQRIDGGQIAGAMGTPAPHPDGQRVAFWYADGIYQIHLDGSGFERLVELGEIGHPVWSPDGNVLAFLPWVALSADREVDFYDTIERQLYELPTDAFLAEENISSYPDGPLSWNER
jgi:hypothetical protein